MKQFKLINNIVGWGVFLMALVVYTMTMESSGSFWDCGEFVSGCYKLEIVHAPGAPLFLMLGHIFTLFASNVHHIAETINFMSALSTAFVVLFCFWCITHLAGKIFFKDGDYSTANVASVIAAGLIGATSCIFVDSLWFSAVEGEVYALSIFFMSFIVWAILKWEDSDDRYADRWLLLIAYMTGVSIGVHLLSLLAIPFIVLIYYYKKYKPTILGFFIANAIGFAIIGFIMKGVLSGTQSYLAGFDKLFVNTLSMPFNSGIVFGLALLTATIVFMLRFVHNKTEKNFYLASVFAGLFSIAFLIVTGSVLWFIVFAAALGGGLYYSRQHNAHLFHIAVLGSAFIYIGYLSYVMVPIRSIANPPINMNRPTDPYSIKGYIDREQYGDRPLLKGPDYTATQYDIVGTDKTGEKFYKNEKKKIYEYVGDKFEYKFSEESQMIFPRLGFWQEQAKKDGYRVWLTPNYNVVDRANKNVVKTFDNNQLKEATDYANSLNTDGQPRYYVKDDISFSDNMRYFFQYQIGYMYMRYLMWNFAGRQNDIQGTFANDDGGWICGIPLIDNNFKVWGHPKWPQDNLSKSMLMNKGRNKFYLIPLILGLIGLVYTYFKNEQIFWAILVFFGTTGAIQLIYSNEPPIEPRERDYALAGSFFAYCFWIGFGVLAIIDFLKKKLPAMPSIAIATVLCASAPFLMGSQGWDDHTRHGRYTARDFAIDYLESCAPNAILFTQGDNDTYPLWYAQEVEGVRPDIRIINLSLAAVDWYIDQLRYKMNDAPAVKLSFTTEQLQATNRDYIRYNQSPGIPAGTPLELKKVMNFIASDDPKNKLTSRDGEMENYLPTKTFFMDIDTNKVKAINMLMPDDYAKMVSKMQWTIDEGAITKDKLVTLDIVANNFYERPIYFAVSVSPDAYVNMDKYFQLEGLAYRLVPKESGATNAQYCPVRTDVAFENMMKKFRFGGIPENPNVYLDENIMRMTMNIRGNFGRLADALILKGENKKAEEALDYAMKSLPTNKVPYNIFNLSYPEDYYRAGAKEKGKKMCEEMWAKAQDELKYYRTVYKYLLDKARDSGDQAYLSQLQQGAFIQQRPVQEQLYTMQQIAQIAKAYEPAEYADKLQKEFKDAQMAFVQKQQPSK